MSHVKFVAPGAYRFDEPQMQLIKVSSRGVVGADRASLVKRAGEDILRDIERWKFEPGEIPVHLFALGSTEKFGCNRNGDGFPEATCEKYHDTFVKYARWYRDHLNTRPERSYGVVKASMYRKPMGRVELIVALNGTKEAAERNGGMVADQEMEKLANGKEIAVSMATPVPYDICSYCGNKARTRDEYCSGIDEGGKCGGGGLRNKIGCVCLLDDGSTHQTHAINPIVRWRDISKVARPADRIGYVTSELKMASDGRVVTSADIAAQFGVRFPLELDLPAPELPTRNLMQQFKIACRLAELETTYSAGAKIPDYQRSACDASAVEDDAAAVPADFHLKTASWLRAMADRRICMPLPQFIQGLTNLGWQKASSIAAIVQEHMPGAFNDLINRSDFHERLRDNPFNPAPTSDAKMHTWALQREAAWGTKSAAVQQRARLAAIRGYESRVDFRAKEAAASDPAKELAIQYALYKIAYLASLPEAESEDALTLSLCVVQNGVR